MICRHMLFFRMEYNLPSYSRSLFSKRWWRIKCNSEVIEESSNIANDETDCKRDRNVIEEETKEVVIDTHKTSKVLTPSDKYHQMNPKVRQIGELMMAHGSPMFSSYLSELDAVEEKVRDGRPLFERDDKVEKNISLLTFKSKLKSKGRPKGTSKLCSFNRGKADRRKKVVRNQKGRKVKEDCLTNLKKVCLNSLKDDCLNNPKGEESSIILDNNDNQSRIEGITIIQNIDISYETQGLSYFVLLLQIIK